MAKEIIDYVNQVVQVFDFGMVGIDFILDENNHWLLNEIEDVVGARMLSVNITCIIHTILF